ncbi:MAG: BLUF domain-containing protein [Bosea sp. (in: a-proteobacteria)]
MSLDHIIYTSTASLPADPAARTASLVALLSSARKFNADHDLSGYLTLVDNQFLQILEGETAPLANVMARIERDQRNHSVLVREHRAIDCKMFEDWAMGCSLEPELLRTAMTFAGLPANPDFANATPDALTTFLVMLSNMSERRKAELAG